MKRALLGALVLIGLTAAQSSATTIDFASGVWNPAGADTITVGSTTVSSSPSLPFGHLDQNSNGLGVVSLSDFLGQPGEIGAFEVLTVQFANPFSLSSFSLGELFFLETGFYSLNGG